MKLAVVLALPSLIAVTLIPAVLSGGDPAPFTGCGLYGGEVQTILATIRRLESGDDYTAQAAGSTASGAYQFIDSTWGNFQGYARAADAPPEVQDAKAAEMVQHTLDTNEGNVATVPVIWYIGHVPPASSPRWDQVPVPQAGNTLTPREYQARWIDTYQRLLDGPPTSDGGEPASIEPGGCVGGAVEAIAGGWSLPGPRALIAADPGALDAPHHDYPAWDWIIDENTPIYAVRGGTVVSTKYWPFNWWSEGCGEQRRRRLHHLRRRRHRSEATTEPAGPTATATTSPSPTTRSSNPANRSCGPATPAAPEPPTSTSKSESTVSSAARSDCSGHCSTKA